MTKSQGVDNRSGGDSAIYRVVVQGRLDESWRDRFRGMSVETVALAGRMPRTTLTGAIRDQGELNAVLETLYALHLPILAVEQIDERNGNQFSQGREP